MSRRPRRTSQRRSKQRWRWPLFEATRRSPQPDIDWKTELLARAADVFGSKPATAEPLIDLNALHAKIGQLALENEYERTSHFPVTASSAKIGF